MCVKFGDLLKILRVGGNPKENKYLFLGDYVDRGNFSVEVVILILCLKLNYPSNVFLIRGNHECRYMTSRFNFRGECLEKYDQETYNMFCDLFDSIPIAAVINNKFLALHAGISPELKTLKNLNKINRFGEPPKAGLFCDILWSDPVGNDKGELYQLYIPNKNRGISYVFGAKALADFLYKNNLLSLIRAHEVQINGYEMLNWKGASFPQVITVFSAANYCGTYRNKGAVLMLEVSLKEQ